jgi:hypothetical protein
MVVSAPDGPAANQGIAVPVRGIADTDTGPDWQEALAADPAGFVFLDDGAGKATVWDGNGKVKVNAAAVPVKADDWTVFAGVLVGQLSDKASPGRVTVAGFGTENLTKRWEFPLAAGASIDKVKPCGPKNVCVVYSLNGSYSIKSIDLSTGKETWSGDMQATFKPNWFLVGAGLLFGEERFGGLAKPELRDPATASPVRSLGTARTTDYTIAAGGRWLLSNGVRVSGAQTIWTVAAIDVTTGKMTSALDVGPSTATIVNASVSGDLLAVVGKNRKLVIGRLPAAK